MALEVASVVVGVRMNSRNRASSASPAGFNAQSNGTVYEPSILGVGP